MISFVALSDTHGVLPSEGLLDDVIGNETLDFIFITGDIPPNFCYGVEDEPRKQKVWYKYEFRTWCENLIDEGYTRNIVFTLGNHDFCTPETIKAILFKGVTCLVDEGTTIDGVSIYGCPWSVTYGDWNYMCSEDELKAKYSLIPQKVDVLLTHTPPRNILDDYDGMNIGSKALAEAVVRKRPHIHIFGHVHEDGGLFYNKATRTLNINACKYTNMIRM